jgi:HlyD family secretion protein
MKKKKSRKRIIIIAVVVVIAGLLILGYVQMRINKAQSEKTTYGIVDVKRGDIEVRVKGAGTVEPLNDNSVYAASAGTVVQVNAENGDVVSADDVIATFKSDELESQRDSLQSQIDELDMSIATLRSTGGSDTVRSPVKGTVMAVYAKDGDNVDAVMDKYGALAVVSPDDLLQINVPLNENIVQGQKLTVTSGSKSAAGEVVKTDMAAMEATVRFDKGDLSAGDTATVTSPDGASLGDAVIQVASPVYITGKGGVVDKVYEDAGDDVSRGGNLFHLDGDVLSPTLYDKIDQRRQTADDLADTKEKLESLTVKAGTDGVVSGLQLNTDQVVQAGAKLFTIKSVDLVKIDVKIDELDIADIKPGQQAAVTFDALPEKQFAGTVTKINPIGASQDNVTKYTATLELGNAEGVMLGMSADVEIVSQTAKNALYIPIEAIQIINGEKYVVMAQDVNKDLKSTPATHKVKTGVTDGVNIEITEGLSEGDQVAVPQVKELSMQEQQMQMFGNRMNGGSKSSGGDSGSSSAPSATE